MAMEFRIERGWSFDGYQAWLLDYRNGRSYIAKPIDLTFEELPEGLMLPEPTLKMNGPFAEEFLLEARKAIAGFNTWDKENYEVSARIEKAMQAHIDSLKLVVERALK